MLVNLGVASLPEPAAPAPASAAAAASSAPAPLSAVLGVTFLASVSGGAFWAGIFFVTAERYAFSTTRNLVLAGLMGAVYGIAARLSGPLSRLLSPRMSPRAFLGAALSIWGVISLLPLLLPGVQAVLWATALLGALLSATIWPIVESYLGAGRHGGAMRDAIGWFNVTWTPATAVPLLAMPLVARVDVMWTISMTALVNAGAVAVLFALPRRPGVHEPERAHGALGREYPSLMRSASWLLPLSYVMSSTLSPVLPHRLAALGGGAASGGAVAATWMVSRFVVLLLMWRTGFWHGRWGTLAIAALALWGGAAGVLLAPTIPLAVLGLVVFGAGMGLTYYAALYYSLAVGHAAVDAGGSFEARIGVGYCVGPAVGLAAHALAGPAAAAAATVGLTSLVASLSAYPVLRPYLHARRLRGRGAPDEPGFG